MIGDFDDVGIMFNHDHAVAFITQLLQEFIQAVYVARVRVYVPSAPVQVSVLRSETVPAPKVAELAYRLRVMGSLALSRHDFAGALIGGFIATSLGYGGVNGFNLGSFIVAVLGSIILLFAYRFLRR